MKIFSSFDTNFKKEILQKEKERFWDKVMLISHWVFFYYFTFLIPAVLAAFLAISYLVIYFYIWFNILEEFKTIYYIFWLLLFIVVLFPVVIKLLKRYIDYILDFVVVTPDTIVYYNQEWILSRRWRTLWTDKIKTISVNKDWLLRSMYNFWNIIILTEWTDWTEGWEGEINFKFVDDPDNIKFKILKIIESKDNLDK